MAILFNDGDSEYVEVDATPIAGPPFVVAAWGRSNDATSGQCVISIADKDGDDHHASLNFAGHIGGDPIRWNVMGTSVDTTAGFTANTWHHVCAIEIAADSRAVFLDGGNKQTNATNKVLANLNRVSIGRLGRSTAGNYMSGSVAELAIWNLTNWPGATAADKAAFFEAIAVPALVAGASPSFWPLGLTYWPLPTVDAIQDRMGTYNMTAYSGNGGPVTAEHPPITYPGSPIYVPGVAAAVGNPWYYYENERAAAS